MLDASLIGKLILVLAIDFIGAVSMGCSTHQAKHIATLPAATAGEQSDPVTELRSACVYSYSIDNSCVIIKSSVSDRLVAQGKQGMVLMVEDMQKPNSDFETFLKEYSVCAQIAENIDPSAKIYWQSGCNVELSHNELHFTPHDLPMPFDAFKTKVIQSIQNEITKISE